MPNVLLGLKQLEKESFKYREEEKTGKTRNHKGLYTERERLGQSVCSSSLSVLSMLEMAMALSIQTDGIHIA